MSAAARFQTLRGRETHLFGVPCIRPAPSPAEESAQVEPQPEPSPCRFEMVVERPSHTFACPYCRTDAHDLNDCRLYRVEFEDWQASTLERR